MARYEKLSSFQMPPASSGGGMSVGSGVSFPSGNPLAEGIHQAIAGIDKARAQRFREKVFNLQKQQHDQRMELQLRALDLQTLNYVSMLARSPDMPAAQKRVHITEYFRQQGKPTNTPEFKSWVNSVLSIPPEQVQYMSRVLTEAYPNLPGGKVNELIEAWRTGAATQAQVFEAIKTLDEMGRQRRERAQVEEILGGQTQEPTSPISPQSGTQMSPMGEPPVTSQPSNLPEAPINGGAALSEPPVLNEQLVEPLAMDGAAAAQASELADIPTGDEIATPQLEGQVNELQDNLAAPEPLVTDQIVEPPLRAPGMSLERGINRPTPQELDQPTEEFIGEVGPSAIAPAAPAKVDPKNTPEYWLNAAGEFEKRGLKDQASQAREQAKSLVGASEDISKREKKTETVASLGKILRRAMDMPTEFGVTATERAMGPWQATAADQGTFFSAIAAVMNFIPQQIARYSAEVQALVDGGASPTEVRDRIEAQGARISAVMKPIIRQPGEGPWTDKDQAFLERITSGLSRSRDVEEYGRRIEDIQAYIETVLGTELDVGEPQPRSADAPPSAEEDLTVFERFMPGSAHKLKFLFPPDLPSTQQELGRIASELTAAPTPEAVEELVQVYAKKYNVSRDSMANYLIMVFNMAESEKRKPGPRREKLKPEPPVIRKPRSPVIGPTVP